jgi:hypothetical protein
LLQQENTQNILASLLSLQYENIKNDQNRTQKINIMLQLRKHTNKDKRKQKNGNGNQNDLEMTKWSL